VIRCRPPSESDLRGLIANRLAAFQLEETSRNELVMLAVGLSHADVCRACDEAAKMAVLGDRRKIAADDLRRAI
jgi:ATP-dependent 26S proteasome regulatory subunit